jgi:hypothetical protein
MSQTVSWSYTTVNTFRQCNRKFYFLDVLARHERKDLVRRKAYELKSMQNLKMWAGSVVDKFLEVTLIPKIRDKAELNFATLAAEAVALAKNQFEFSKNGLYKDGGLKKGEVGSQFCILDIHEVNAPYTESELAEAFDNIRQAIENFPQIRMPDGVLLIDFLNACNRLTPNVNNWLVYVEKARVKPQMDLLALHSWKPVVMDWKLSASFSSDYSRQLIISGITVFLKRLESTDKKPYTYGDIRLYEVNLLKGEVKQHEFTEEKVHELINYITLTAEDIFLLKGDSEGEDLPDIDNFEFTDDPGLCSSCNFQTLCTYLLENKNKYDEKLYLKSIQTKQRL